MQSVIAGYEYFDEALRAVRSLERHQLSIHDVVIADQEHRMWRRSRLSSEQRARLKGRRSNFLVIMTGEASNVARATALLRQADDG